MMLIWKTINGKVKGKYFANNFKLPSWPKISNAWRMQFYGFNMNSKTSKFAGNRCLWMWCGSTQYRITLLYQVLSSPQTAGLKRHLLAGVVISDATIACSYLLMDVTVTIAIASAWHVVWQFNKYSHNNDLDAFRKWPEGINFTMKLK